MAETTPRSIVRPQKLLLPASEPTAAVVSAFHHVTIAIQDETEVVRFLSDILGVEVVASEAVPANGLGPLFSGSRHTGVTSTMLGSSACGLVEVVSIPSMSSPAECTYGGGIRGLSFSVKDVDTVVASARMAGFDVPGEPERLRFGGHDVRVAVVVVSGVPMQLTQVL